MPRRWIPRKGEYVKLAGSDVRPAWEGIVVWATKADCKPGEVYLKIQDLGATTATKDEITIIAATA